MLKQVPVTCNKDCAGGCPLWATVEEGRLTHIADNPARGPYMRGCRKGYSMPRTVYAPDRLTRPLIRTGERGSGSFREAGWNEALCLVASRLAEISAAHGPESIFYLGGSGACRGVLHHTKRVTLRFLSLLGGYTEAEGSYSQQAAAYVARWTLGTTFTGLDAGTLYDSELIILWGANVVDCRAGCELESRLREARQRGVEIIVIDPRRTSTAERLGTRWLPVRPGSDSALMMAVLYVLLQENLVDRPFIAAHSDGFEALERAILGQDGSTPRTPTWAEERCGTPAQEIIALARQYGRSHPTALLPGLSIQRTLGGEDAFRMSIALQVATGNLGVMGGSSGGQVFGGMPRPRFANMPIPANSRTAAVPVLLWPDAILQGPAGGFPSSIQAIYNVGGNYIGQGSDVHKSIRAYRSVKFSVCHDYFLTPTARWCDVVLPATTFLERADIIIPTTGNYLLFSEQAIEPVGLARNDYDIFSDLAQRMGFGSAYTENRSSEEWLRYFLSQTDIPDHEAFRASGLYVFPDQLRAGLSTFSADPVGSPLATPSGKVQIDCRSLPASGLSPLPEPRSFEPSAAFPLYLITPKTRDRIHSQGFNIPELREREPHVLWMHPSDAATRGIADGQSVLAYNAQGRVRVPVRFSTGIIPGVTCLLQGAWPELEPDGTDTAGCANILSSTEPTLPSLGTRTHSIAIQVQSA